MNANLRGTDLRTLDAVIRPRADLGSPLVCRAGNALVSLRVFTWLL